MGHLLTDPTVSPGHLHLTQTWSRRGQCSAPSTVSATRLDSEGRDCVCTEAVPHGRNLIDNQLLNEWLTAVFGDSLFGFDLKMKLNFCSLSVWVVQILGKPVCAQFADFILLVCEVHTLFVTCCVLIPLIPHSSALIRAWLEKSPVLALSHWHQDFQATKQKGRTHYFITCKSERITGQT